MVELRGAAKQRYVAQLFSRISRRYDLMNDVMTLGMHRGWKRRTAYLASEGSIGAALDVATGTGDLAFALGRCPGVEKVVGIDLMPDMIEIARGKWPGSSRASRADLLVGDALSLPFPDGTFACATAGFSLRNIPNVEDALAEMVRVLKPGGRLAILELTPMKPGIRSRLFRFYFHGLVPLIGQLVADDRSAYTYLPKSVDYFPSADKLAGMLSDTGLAPVGYRKLGFGTVSLHWGEKPAG